MSERGGSVRDARFLSGADIGRTITLRDGMKGTIDSVHHDAFYVTVGYTAPWGPGFDEVTFLRNDAVTITGADATTPKTAATTPEPAN